MGSRAVRLAERVLDRVHRGIERALAARAPAEDVSAPRAEQPPLEPKQRLRARAPSVVFGGGAVDTSATRGVSVRGATRREAWAAGTTHGRFADNAISRAPVLLMIMGASMMSDNLAANVSRA